MPLYVLRCPTHGVFESLCTMGAWPATCDRCGAKVEKLPTAAAPRFKGPGFYATDYAGGAEEVEA